MFNCLLSQQMANILFGISKKNVSDLRKKSRLEEYQEDHAASLGLFLGHYHILCSGSYSGSSSIY